MKAKSDYVLSPLALLQLNMRRHRNHSLGGIAVLCDAYSGDIQMSQQAIRPFPGEAARNAFNIYKLDSRSRHGCTHDAKSPTSMPQCDLTCQAPPM